jgi:hypothetical protein
MNDVLDRLRACNPVTELDIVEAGVPPLALPASRPRVRRRFAAPGRVAAVAAVLAALVLAAGLPGDRSSGPGGAGRLDVAAAVAAALDPGDSILHIVTRSSQSGPNGQQRSWRTDVWLAPGGREGRVRVVPTEGKALSFRVAGDDPLDPVMALRAMLRDGTLRRDGRTLLDGRAVETLSSRDGETTLYADPETMQPLRTVLRRSERHGPLTAVTDFLTVERLENTPENRREFE